MVPLDDELRMLVITSFVGLEQSFVEVSGTPREEEEDVVELAEQFGTRIVGPPIGSL